jgi:DNA polymerase-3 subunit delta
MAAEKPHEDIKKVYLFSGEVDPRRQSAVDELIEQLVDPEVRAFDLQEFDGNESSAEGILSAASTVPLLSERKVVVVDRVERLNPEDQLKIAGFIPKMGAKTCLILLVGEDESRSRPRKASREKENSESQKRKRGLQQELVTAVKKHGVVVSFAKLKSEGIGALVSKQVTSRGKKIESLALQNLSRIMQASPSTIESEVEKLCAYVGDHEIISAGDVDQVITKSPEDRIFPLIDAVAAGQEGHAVHLLNETFAASARPDIEVLRILPMVAKHFRMLYQVKFLQTQGVRVLSSTPEELRSLLPLEHNPLSLLDWQQRKLMDQARAFSLDEIRTCMKEILACELAAKGQGEADGSPKLHMEILVLKLSRRKQAQRAAATR